jgi:hypothetical protein
MAVVARQKFTGYTLEQYDAVTAKLGITPGGSFVSPGLLFHYVVATDEGLEITDIWTSREAFETFLNEKVVPVAQEVGVSPPTSVEFSEVHNYNTAG